MIIGHNFTPIIDLGIFKIHIYGIIIAIAFFVTYYITKNNLNKKNAALSDDNLMSMLGLGFVFAVITARIGYVFIYWGKEYLRLPSEIFKIQEGGLSYHTGLIGAVIALFIYAKLKKISFLGIADAVSFAIPAAVALGRVGSFIYGELWGRLTNGSWGVLFSKSAEQPMPRHPSQIYEALLEGLLVFVILNILGKREHSKGYIFSMFLILSGVMRFITEFFREPDMQLGFIFSNFTMGQVLSVPVIIAGIIVLVFSSKKSAEN